MTGNGAGGTAGHVASVAGLAMMLVLLPFFLASGLMAPPWGVALLIAVWLGLFVLGVRSYRSRPVLVLLLPVVAAGIWVAVMAGGEATLGWTA